MCFQFELMTTYFEFPSIGFIDFNTNSQEDNLGLKKGCTKSFENKLTLPHFFIKTKFDKN